MPQNELELIDYLLVLRRRIGVILLCTFVCMASALAICFVLPPVYRGTLILEVGRLYSFSKGENQEKIDLIENPINVESILKSDVVLQQLKTKLQLTEEVRDLRESLKVDTKAVPMAILSLEMKGKPQILDSLNYLAQWIIKDHAEKQVYTIRALENNIDGVKGKISKAENKIQENNSKKEQVQKKIESIEAQARLEREQIKTDSAYQKVVAEETKQTREAVDELKKKVGAVDLKQASSVDVLFLQTSFHNAELRLAEFLRETNDLRQRETERMKSVAERQKQTADLTIVISDIEAQNNDLESQINDLKRTVTMFENLKAQSVTTRIRNDPVVVEKPVSPRKGLTTMVAGAIGFIVSLIVALFREFLKGSEAWASRDS